ncbi:hypothetical protein FRC96_02535 [Lujinxingia vulgaris]|uniref:Uncharacterized protein n=1 Tax=Lujinxingia vulgaris TaxID=2600176 RepID=A0A5C6XGI0_9DELT|nr:hypothetical protein [Lujinxingia vulgaris]TXD42782.1 hypothetical protein FRC96_02535 [Lujinxingia vulgaris]
MSSDDGSHRPPAPARPGAQKPRLNVAGDLPTQANHDRVSTVMIHAEDPTPPPGHRPNLAQHDPEETFPPGASVPAQSLTGQHRSPHQRPAHQPQGPATGQHNAAHLQQHRSGQQHAHPQQGFTGQHNAAHLQQGSATGQHNAAHLQQGFTGRHNAAHLQQGYASQSAHDAEHLTNTGFIPTEAFKAARAQQQAAGGKKPARARRIQIGGRTFELPSFGMSEMSADAKQRVIYSICATMAGGLIGFVLGAFNARLQGWTVSEGTAEMHLLAMVCALTFGIMAYMRPQQVDQVLVKIGLLSAADADPDRTDELRIR